MDQGTYLQNSKERHPRGVWKLERSHIIIYGKQGAQQDHNQQDTSRSGFFTQEGTSQFLNRQRNCATLYIHFVDFEKAFDSIHRDSLWIIMRQYGIPTKMVQMVKALYEDFQCSVIDEGGTTEWFPVMTGVKQGCCMSGFLFLLVIDWVMRRTTVGERTGIRWDFTTMLEDLDFADGLALLSSAMNHLQQKTSRLEVNAAKIGLKLNDKKCKVMKANSRSEKKLRVREMK